MCCVITMISIAMHWLQHHWWLLMIIDQISVLAAGVFCGGRLHCVWPNWWYWRAGFHWPILYNTRIILQSIHTTCALLLFQSQLFFLHFSNPCGHVKEVLFAQAGGLFIWSENDDHWPFVKHTFSPFQVCENTGGMQLLANKKLNSTFLPLYLSCELDGAMPMYSLGVKTRMGENLPWALASNKTFLLSFSGAREEWQAGKQWGARRSKKSNLTCL